MIDMVIRLIFVGILLTLTTFTFGQDNIKIVERYKRHDKIGPFFMRWYWRLLGLPSTVWVDILVLKEDKSFVHYSSTTCLPSWEYGKWERENNKLVLKINSMEGNVFYSAVVIEYVIHKRRLYHPLDNPGTGRWVMKKKIIGREDFML